MHTKFKENRAQKGLRTVTQISSWKSDKYEKCNMADKDGAGISVLGYTNASHPFDEAASISILLYLFCPFFEANDFFFDEQNIGSGN